MEMFLKQKTTGLLAGSVLAGMIGIASVAHAAAGPQILGLSSDGSIMLSSVYDENGYALRLTNTITGQIQNIGFPDGANGFTAEGLSADGKTVTGYSYNSADGKTKSFVWTAANGFVDLGVIDSGTTDVYASSVSGDGTAVTGYAGGTGSTEAFYWTSSTGMIGLGTLGGNSSYGNAVSDDASTVVGYSHTIDSSTHAFVWKTDDRTMVNIDTLYDYSSASMVSDDGSVVAGEGSVNNSSGVFRWTEATGMVDIAT